MSDITTYSFSPAVTQAQFIASRIATENRHATYGAAHLLKALLHPDLPLRNRLETLGADIYYLEEWAEIRMEEYPKSTRYSDTLEADAVCEVVYIEAEHFQLGRQMVQMDPECLLIALSMPGVAFSHEQLKSFPLSAQMLKEQFSINERPEAENRTNGRVAPTLGASLKKYCIDKLNAANSPMPVTGRTKEIRQLCEILSRKTKSNALIIGEAGVGKTALLDGLVTAALNDQLPANLKHATIFALDNGAFFSGAAYKGEIEDRLQKIINELLLFEKPILLIDGLQALVDPQTPNGGAAGTLKAALEKGNLAVVATTTADAWQKQISGDESLSRRFEMVKLAEPDPFTAETMLRSHAAAFEQHYGITIKEEVFPEAVRLAKRYANDRKLPDPAVDLLDRTLAVARMTADISGRDLAALQRRLVEADPDALYDEARASLSPLLLQRGNETRDLRLISDAAEKRRYLSDLFENLSKLALSAKQGIDVADIQVIMSGMTGIPIGKIQTKEQQRLVNMEQTLRQRVIGQDQALRTVADAIVEARSGLIKAGQPIASFFFLGPTGTGKTELAKSLAEFLFEDEKAMIRFDMSEFKEEHSAALLYGAPPGYVGYENGGLLVNKIRDQPYAIVLFDEIEKAHPSVFDLFLQILDEGRIHDRLGREGDFSNAVILFTSNIGAEEIGKSGTLPGADRLMTTMSRYFRPEFLGRLTEIVPFAPVVKENMTTILFIHLQPLVRQLAAMEIKLDISPEAAGWLADRGWTPQYGVRPLKGVIRNDLRKPLSRMIVNDELKKGDHVSVRLNEQGELKFLK